MKQEKDESKQYSANFLWGHADDSIESLGYEFANAKTEAYQKECWNQLLEKIREEANVGIIPFLESDRVHHLPTCNINQNWEEAFSAFADTPYQYRDESYNQAYNEAVQKSQTCTCGLNQLISKYFPQSQVSGSLNQPKRHEQL